MGVKFANNAFGTLNASIASGDASLTLSSGQGARFPSLSSGDYFYATLIDTSNNLEVVKCTARSSDVLTITRGQESTTARAFAVGDRVELRVTAAGLNDATDIDYIVPSQSGNSGEYLTTDGTNVSWGVVTAPTPAAVSEQANTSTGYFDIPAGTTAQRPSSPGSGFIRYNSTTGEFEGYDGSQWRQLNHSTLVASATTDSNRTLTASESWTTHLSASITTAYKGPIMCVAQAAHGYESGAVNLIGRFTGPATSPEMQVFVQGFGSNRAQGIHSMQYTFANINAGSYTVNWQVRNDGGSSTAIMNYNFVTGLYNDRLDVYYLG